MNEQSKLADDTSAALAQVEREALLLACHLPARDLLRGFGVTITAGGQARRWYVGADGVKRWHDSDLPVGLSP